MQRSQRALKVYRDLLRTQHTVFSGDALAQERARSLIRQEFEAHRGVQDAKEIDDLIARGNDTIAYVRGHVVQAVKNDRGNWEMKLRPENKFIKSKDFPMCGVEF
ncbi:LYR motifcontaining protein 7, putative [Acanthamoeba castellanii str. Neff]|uniref:LYR motifcontaining protein 7, putative n=1 Tax=Acanthamoeba castellanii (strain ATCC 30010 / Neff) TaxID=1257118 RepID=L8GP62_ACACF|nr:LYR motifcontaining protein 7, putative [Acanthamoeba castellanii str. Neff]ELR14677.1 LYR motifcontaining protein 7, putative [Acanthamoeba castellanii str. Neff]